MVLSALKFDCLVVGAGLGGIAAARKLVEAGVSVCILEKSRGIGGRLATRRLDGESFDHGAQFFTTRKKSFEKEVEQWIANGIAQSWFEESGHVRYRGVGAMNSMAKQLAAGLDVRREQKVDSIRFANGVWTVRSEKDSFECERLLLATPAPQAVALLESGEETFGADFLDTLKTIEYEKCISLMLLLESELNLSDSGLIKGEPGEPIATITETSIKGTTGRPGIVIQSGSEFAEKYFGEPADSISTALLGALPFQDKLKVVDMSLQKWRFAKRKEHGLSAAFLKSENEPLWHAGDGYVAARVEGAYLSGIKVANSIIESFRKAGELA
ncbi:MAG: NAD(P)-binding protein [Opitutales bacterium]|jgi:renalase|nr:NAD(P)-binding protein [Opitutales bacterium]MBT6381307.1 NAD(P)-binding protein [Opitutales bacterium]MBT6769941.1 NAD(P)-binding protein [Opitutales bacterium]MBT7866084.1 NAD(P)-binding protein [Opitutales bacterium]